MRGYRDFCDFQDGVCRHVEFSKIQNFVKIGQTAAEIWRFNGF